MPKVAEKKILTKPSQGSLRASNLVLYQRGGARLPSVGFKTRSTCQGNKDLREPSPRFASNGIHMKSAAENLQGHGLGKSLGVSQVCIRRRSQNPVSQREVLEEHPLKLSRTFSREK